MRQARYGLPETNSNPEDKDFKKTTRLPRNLPASKINTVPGVIVDRICDISHN